MMFTTAGVSVPTSWYWASVATCRQDRPKSRLAVAKNSMSWAAVCTVRAAAGVGVGEAVAVAVAVAVVAVGTAGDVTVVAVNAVNAVLAVGRVSFTGG